MGVFQNTRDNFKQSPVLGTFVAAYLALGGGIFATAAYSLPGAIRAKEAEIAKMYPPGPVHTLGVHPTGPTFVQVRAAALEVAHHRNQFENASPPVKTYRFAMPTPKAE